MISEYLNAVPYVVYTYTLLLTWYIRLAGVVTHITSLSVVLTSSQDLPPKSMSIWLEFDPKPRPLIAITCPPKSDLLHGKKLIESAIHLLVTPMTLP